MLALRQQDRRQYAKAFVETSVGLYIVSQLRMTRDAMIKDHFRKMLKRELVRFMMFN